MFPLQRAPHLLGYEMACVKDGVNYARPPLDILTRLLAVRLHLDDCDENNGPLRISPRTHNLGIIKSAEINARMTEHGDIICTARESEALLMRPLTLHASSTAKEPRHRRVLHLVFHEARDAPEPWWQTA